MNITFINMRKRTPSATNVFDSEMGRLKQCLLSKIDKNVQWAVEKIVTLLEDEKLVDVMLNFDLPVLLSEVLNPIKCNVNAQIYGIILRMCQNRRFYTDNHATAVTFSACRSTKFLIKSKTINSELIMTVTIIKNIMNGYTKYSVNPTKKLMDQVNEVTHILVHDETINDDMQYPVARLLVSILNVKQFRLRQSSVQKTFETVLHCFSRMTALSRRQALDSLPYEAMVLACSMASHISQMLVTTEMGTQGFSLPEQSKCDLLTTVSNFLTYEALPVFLKMTRDEIISNIDDIAHVFRCYVFLLKNNSTNSQLVHTICSAHILRLLHQALCNVSEASSTKDAALTLLSIMLNDLSMEVFRFPEMWPAGVIYFRRELEFGISSLEFNPIHWLSILCDVNRPLSVKLVILLYNFFWALAETSPNDPNTFVAVCNFVVSSVGVHFPPLILKVIWLLMAAGKSYDGNKVHQNIEEKAISELIVRLQCVDIDYLYTHNPVILKYTFEGGFPSSFQLQVMKLWFRNQEEDSEELRKLLQNSEEARFAALDLIQTGDSLERDRAGNAFQAVLLERMESPAITVWRMLPDALSRLTSDDSLGSNALALVKLALMAETLVVDHEILPRVSSMIPVVLTSMDYAPLPILQLSHMVLMLLIEIADYDVVADYLRSSQFLKILFDNFFSSESGIAAVCIKIAACLNNIHRTQLTIPVEHTVEIDPEKLVTLLVHEDHNVRRSTVLFLQELLESSWEPSICCLTVVSTPDLVRKMFFHLLNFCFLDSSDYVWECLNSCISFYEENHPVTQHLAAVPWLFYLLQVHSSKLSENRQMMLFVTKWLRLRPKQVVTPLRLSLPIDLKVIELLADRSLSTYNVDMEEMCSEMLKCDLSPRILCALSQRLGHSIFSTHLLTDPEQVVRHYSSLDPSQSLFSPTAPMVNDIPSFSKPPEIPRLDRDLERFGDKNRIPDTYSQAETQLDMSWNIGGEIRP